jgi:hypothetical protein
MNGGQAVPQEERERKRVFFFLILFFCADGLYVILGSTFDL